jgi:hypothetical protein
VAAPDFPTHRDRPREARDYPVTLDVTPDARVVLDGLPAGLADVPTGKPVELELGLDKKSVLSINVLGPWDHLPGTVESCDPVALTLAVELWVGGRDGNGRPITLVLPVNADAKVRLAGADARLADLKPRMPVRLKLTADRKGVAGVLAGPPEPPPPVRRGDK